MDKDKVQAQYNELMALVTERMKHWKIGTDFPPAKPDTWSQSKQNRLAYLTGKMIAYRDAGFTFPELELPYLLTFQKEEDA